MDFFNGKTDSEVLPKSVDFFAVVDPTLSHDENDSQDQILMFWNGDEMGAMAAEEEDDVKKNERLRKIGIIQGVNEFTKGFGTEENADPLDYIELDNQLIIFQIFEERYQIILSINLTKISDEGQVEYIHHDISPIVFLRKLIVEGYNDFTLHNGSILRNFEGTTSDEFKALLKNWWILWLKNLQLEIVENGALKLYQGYKKSSHPIKSIPNDVDPGLLHNLFIFNTDKSNFEAYGVVYEPFDEQEQEDKLTLDSKIHLLNWIEELDNYNVLTTNGIIATQVLKTPLINSAQNGEISLGLNSEVVYDPFKLVFNTLTEVSRVSGVTAGVNAGVNGISSGISTINGLLPSWIGRSHDGEDTGDVEEGREGYEPIVNEDKSFGFLIGKVGEDIVKKEVWLEKEGVLGCQRCNVIIFKYFELVLVKVVDCAVDSFEYYDDLGKQFVSILQNLGEGQPIIKKKDFYFMIYDQLSKSIESNIPQIPLFDDEEVNDLKYFHDLKHSKTQSIYLHQEMMKLLEKNHRAEIERLTRTKNGWWILKLLHNDKEIIIIKKWAYNSPTQLPSSSSTGNELRDHVLKNSTSLIGSIGKDAKLWLEDYLTKNEV